MGNIRIYPSNGIASALVRFGKHVSGGGDPAAITLHAGHELPRLSMRETCANLGGTVTRGGETFGLPTVQEVFSAMAAKEALLASIYEIRRDPDGTRVLERPFGGRWMRRNEALSVLRDFAILAGWLRYFAEHPDRIVIEQVSREFLPPGKLHELGPRATPEPEADESKRVRRGDIEIPERMKFLEEMGALEKVMEFTEDALGSGGKDKYKAYLVRNHDDRLVALVDRALLNNALYAFDAEDPQWLPTAQLSRNEVRSGDYPCFLARIVHRGDWQGQIYRLLGLVRTV